ncbi:hypothetical protein DYB32_009825 [Aphanomyces invadans]|uniref:ATP-dependent RNA helicase Ski2/MTR4 C-terminal domain-containing protein n=1 Tax=Aphanomyces invadans TaxID=157072 RepID=A0A418AJ68_9STRA|nr:hypothetical protein DYB32_009825 [Aphanomyces invadans]
MLARLEDELEQTHGGHMDLDQVQLFYELSQESKMMEKHLVQMILNSKYAATALCIGRVVVISTADLPDAVAIVLQGTVKSFVALALCPPAFSPPVAPTKRLEFQPLTRGSLGGGMSKPVGLKVGDVGSLLGKHYVVLELPESCVDLLTQISKLRNYVAAMTAALSNHSLSLFPDFQQRLQVLTRLGYIAKDNTVQVKGRVACEVNTCEELILTEIIFENVLASLEPEEIVSVLSALIFQEKTQHATTLTPRLMDAQKTVQAIATSLGLIQLEAQLEIDPHEYVKSTLNFGLMEVVYEWSRGMPFQSICQLTDVPEGSIVRCMTRLDEVCREVRNAARVIGDPRLYRKMEIASESIKRDVVFATSLYLS